jgi:NADH:ubiquinone oxidoreductase subunit F (NADH-binding)
MSNTASEAVSRVIESTPHVAISGLIIAGVSVQDWYVVLASAFVLLQAGYFVYSKFIKKDKDK